MIALDLFAGTGWGVACRELGIEEYGVDNEKAVIATREANGMKTIFEDVWDGLDDESLVPYHDLLIASPPCQTFSMAGKGSGRKALDDVIGLIDRGDYKYINALRQFGEETDPRTALVLAPLAYIAYHMPKFVVLEQVPSVLPVWKRYAEELESFGYSVVTGVLKAEQYGVPQTRKRAILIARGDGIEAKMPEPTHSAYYSRNPEKLDDGVLPWISMADALGWGMTRRPFVTAGNAVGRAEGVGGSGAKEAIHREYDAGRWAEHRPATTIVGSFAPDIVAAPGYRPAGSHSRQNAPGSVRITKEEAAALQSYPSDFEWVGTKTATFRQIGNAVPPLLAKAILETLL